MNRRKEKWRKKNWLGLLGWSLLVVLSLTWIFYVSDWDVSKAIYLIKELSGNIIISGLLWLLGLIFSIVSLSSLVSKYRNHSNIKAFIDNVEKFEMPAELKEKSK